MARILCSFTIAECGCGCGNFYISPPDESIVSQDALLLQIMSLPDQEKKEASREWDMIMELLALIGNPSRVQDTRGGIGEKGVPILMEQIAEKEFQHFEVTLT